MRGHSGAGITDVRNHGQAVQACRTDAEQKGVSTFMAEMLEASSLPGTCARLFWPEGVGKWPVTCHMCGHMPHDGSHVARSFIRSWPVVGCLVRPCPEGNERERSRLTSSSFPSSSTSCFSAAAFFLWNSMQIYSKRFESSYSCWLFKFSLLD